MQKFTIIIGILAVCVIAVIAEVLTHDYSFIEPDYMKANVIEMDGKEYAIEDLLFSDEGVADFTIISEADLMDAGLYDYSLQRVSYEGKLFEFVDLSEFENLSVTVLKFVDNSLNIPTIVGAVYRLDFEDEALSGEMYRVIKERVEVRDGFTINETDAYGDASLFINDDLRIGTAFLLVKSGGKVYAFTYPKVRHENIRKLIEKLHG